MKILSVVGARPQFIKLAPLSHELRKYHTEVLIHTGQHYDRNMSDVFFKELCIPRPDYNLGVGSGSHGSQTGEMIVKLEKVLLKEEPEMVLVYGDTNSTLAGALTAAKLNIPLAHVEAGLRSFDRSMPEEINRVLTDHCSNLLFCPTEASTKNLMREGITDGVYLVGDVMYDALHNNEKLAIKKSRILDELSLDPKGYLLATVHRPANTDNKENFTNILRAFIQSGEKIILPIHPRAKKMLNKFNLCSPIKNSQIHLTEPVSYLDMILLEKNAKKILTDSGGVQKESYFFGIPCITLRENTEWVETIADGWNILVGAKTEKILHAIQNFKPKKNKTNLYGDGKASKKILKIILSYELNS